MHCNYLEYMAKEFGFETAGRPCGFLSEQIEVVNSGRSLHTLDNVWRGWTLVGWLAKRLLK